TLSLLLLLMGVMGFMGTVLIGSLLRRSLHMPLVIIPVLMAVIALTLAPLGGHVAPVAMLLGLWGLLATAAPVGWWSWVAQAMPDDAEAGGGMMVAVVQLAIALGSTLGGVLFDSRGHASAFAASAFVLLTSALLSFQASRAPALQAA
ncbi:MAG: MFS transporter, partial [Rhizobacter sp.]